MICILYFEERMKKDEKRKEVFGISRFFLYVCRSNGRFPVADAVAAFLETKAMQFRPSPGITC